MTAQEKRIVMMTREEQGGCRQTAANAAAGLAALVLVLTLPLLLLIHNLAGSLFSRERISTTLERELVESGYFYEMLWQALLPEEEVGVRDTGGIDLLLFFGHLTEGDRQQIAEILMPQDWLREQVSHAMDEVFGWLNGNRPAPKLSIDLIPLKRTLDGEGGRQILEIVVASWPVCTEEDLARLSQPGLDMGGGGFIYCEPPEPLRSQYVESGLASFRAALSAIPEIIFIFGTGPEGISVARFVELRSELLSLGILANLSWLSPLLLMGIIMVFAIRSWKEMLYWWGIPLLVGGAICLAVVVAGNALSDLILRGILASAGAPPLLTEGLRAVLLSFIHDGLERMAAQTVAVGGAGVLLLLAGLVSYLWGRTVRKKGPGNGRPSLDREVASLARQDNDGRP
jgi:hypothetical protein